MSLVIMKEEGRRKKSSVISHQLLVLSPRSNVQRHQEEVRGKKEEIGIKK
ncbi:hypothetical protein [Tychonema sp. LEGE 07203]|nr:hypothetical protein [Tychonema sp. LEGE 07203]MBE9092800.1 hypothetical protein [Tychonema sp. LEGE 07203]